MVKNLRAFLFLPFLLFACGLPKVGNVPLPDFIPVGNQSVQIFLPASYMGSINNFQGISFFYKIYPAESTHYADLPLYSSFDEAYEGDFRKISQSFTAESTLLNHGYLPFNRNNTEESSLPILRISQADQGRELLLTLDFTGLLAIPRDTSPTAWAILTENGNPVPGYSDFPLLRKVIDPRSPIGQYKTLGFLTHFTLDSQKLDLDLKALLSTAFIKQKAQFFNIVIYGVVYAGDVFEPIRSQAFRLNFIGQLTSGST